MKLYYQGNWVTQYCGDALEILSELPDNSVDLMATDPPYGIGFMDKEWDTFKPDYINAKMEADKRPHTRIASQRRSNTAGTYDHSRQAHKKYQEWLTNIWIGCLRVLKPGAFAFISMIPRQDSLSRAIMSLEDAGFETGFTSIYWAYASGFPKAQNIGKAVDKRLRAEREIVGQKIRGDVEKAKQSGSTFAVADANKNNKDIFGYGVEDLTLPATPQAKALEGSYGGFQPKPAVEVIIVAMKPLSEKTFVDQALNNRKGITWLDDGRIPYESEGDKEGARFGTQMDIRNNNYKTPQGVYGKNVLSSQSGRFPANLLVSDDVLNDGKDSKSPKTYRRNADSFGRTSYQIGEPLGKESLNYGDSGSFSRYFDLDKWAQKTFPFLIVPKASKSEKNRGCEDMLKHKPNYADYRPNYETTKGGDTPYAGTNRGGGMRNYHPTVKPLKLMSYLITLGSREGDTVLDPFSGSGTTLLASQLLGRKSIGIEIEEKYCEIAANRCRQMVMELNI